MRLERHTWLRTKTGYSWRSSEDNMTGHTIDDLNKKTLQQAENPYEKVFILIRDELEHYNTLSMTDEINRLTLCQVISGLLSERIN